MKSRTWIYVGCLGVAAIALMAWAFAPRPAEVEVAALTQGQFESSIDEDAKTRLRDRYVVSAPLSGLLSRVGLREGDSVDAGAVVATLMPTLAPMLDERTLREQQLRVEITEAQVRRVDARVQGAEVAVLQARNEVRRSEQLAAQNFVSPTKLETDRLAAMAAQKELDAARAERHVAGHEVEQARAALMTVRGPQRTGSRSFVLRAPVAGRVLRVAQTSEAAVVLGAPLLELGDVRSLEVVADLLTTDALKASPGSRVLIERWGGQGSLNGRVRLIEPSAFTKISALGVEEQRVKVVIDITSPADQWQALGDGFRVAVRIVTTSVDNAVKVPVGAVFPLREADGNSGTSMAVFAIEGERARLVPVHVRMRNGSEAWLQTNLPLGTRVVVYPSAAVKDGVRVKVRKV
ncbi:MAG: HlyD family efflux transporter periplasmic adaptor subunit [Burkholderiaceae bacterium]